MLFNYLRNVPFRTYTRLGFGYNVHRSLGSSRCVLLTTKAQELTSDCQQKEPEGVKCDEESLRTEIYPAARVVPMVLTSNKEAVVLPFDHVPGPKALKYFSHIRSYFSEIGTQVTVGILTFGLDMGSYIKTKKPIRSLSVLFDEYGPVVRFISPVGSDIVLINHPDHIQKVFSMEGEYPIRSTLDSLEKYRMEHRNHVYGGLYSTHGDEWYRQRTTVDAPLNQSLNQHLHSIDEVCDTFAQKIYSIRNYQDEVSKDLYREIHKWAFDCMGLLLLSKKFRMLDTELIYNQCDMSWLYYSLDKATDAIGRCESGLHMWKLFSTPAWSTLVKHCDSLDSLIGKHVTEAEQALSFNRHENNCPHVSSLINAMLLGQEKMSAEDIVTVIMDLLIIGVNTVTSSTSFLLYNLAKHQKAQKLVYKEVEAICSKETMDLKTLIEDMPYFQACIKETLRLVPPISVLTRILPKNIVLDRYNIPQGTLVMMSPQDASLKESNFEDALSFRPERWLKPDAKDYHSYASIPFGQGARKCLGQNIAVAMMSLLTIKLLQKYKLEYHYGDIEPRKRFISVPNRPLKIRFSDRI